MSNATFDELLAKMPAIADAVNAFKSEGVQQQAFQVLLHGLSGDGDVRSDEERLAGHTRQKRKSSARAERSDGVAAKPVPRKRRSLMPVFVRDLNLRPKEKDSFRDFIAAKSPETNHERNAVCVYWLTRIAEVDAVSVDHVYTCYKEANWKVPPNLGNSLAVTANKKGWVNTEDMQNITITVPGENFVEHDLPAKTKVA